MQPRRDKPLPHRALDHPLLASAIIFCPRGISRTLTQETTTEESLNKSPENKP